MPAVTRIGDGTVGVCDIGAPCCAHGRSGTNTTGSPDVFVNNIPVQRLQDNGSCNCPHGGTYASTTGSSTVFVNGLPVTRIGDVTTCMSCGKTGSHTEGSPNVFIGG